MGGKEGYTGGLENMTSAEMDDALDKFVAGQPVTDAEQQAAEFRMQQYDNATFASDPDFEGDATHQTEVNK